MAATSKKQSRAMPDKSLSGLGKILRRHAQEKGALIAILQEAQAAYGHLSVQVLEEICRSRGVPLAAVYGVATFYAQFRLQPHGETEIKVCHGTACYVSGAQRVAVALESELGVKSGETTADGRFTLENVGCLGCCSLAPVITVGEMTCGRLNPDLAVEAVRRYG